ncbi:hypothetical protein PQR05_37700 [Paraburkholderia sediminicola]|uniref:hypothetical protein n=1 Tax=Paraburkholderia sediminicola TaxID=458836 RepID=UPI0038B6E9F1
MRKTGLSHLQREVIVSLLQREQLLGRHLLAGQCGRDRIDRPSASPSLPAIAEAAIAAMPGTPPVSAVTSHDATVFRKSIIRSPQMHD